jgi:hypothetical protein
VFTIKDNPIREERFESGPIALARFGYSQQLRVMTVDGFAKSVDQTLSIRS